MVDPSKINSISLLDYSGFIFRKYRYITNELNFYSNNDKVYYIERGEILTISSSIFNKKMIEHEDKFENCKNIQQNIVNGKRIYELPKLIDRLIDSYQNEQQKYPNYIRTNIKDKYDLIYLLDSRRLLNLFINYPIISIPNLQYNIKLIDLYFTKYKIDNKQLVGLDRLNILKNNLDDKIFNIVWNNCSWNIDDKKIIIKNLISIYNNIDNNKNKFEIMKTLKKILL